MKKVSHLICMRFLTAAAFAQQLTPVDRDKAVQYRQQTEDGVAAAIKGLTESQLKFKPAPDCWSIAETLEHIASAEDFIFQNVTDKVMKAPPPLKPTGRWTPDETLDHFQRSRAKTIEYLEATPDLPQHAVDSPLGQPLDAYEWLLFIGAHSARHTKQILEVKSDPNFPTS